MYHTLTTRLPQKLEQLLLPFRIYHHCIEENSDEVINLINNGRNVLFLNNLIIL